MTVTEHVHPAALSLPEWPALPEPVDPGGSSYFVVAVGGTESSDVTAQWVRQAEAMAPTVVAVFDSLQSETELAALRHQLAQLRTGVRILVVGGQFDVLTALAAARSAGALGAELRSFVVHQRDLPLYCAHCRATFRAEAAPGDEVTCPGCAHRLEIHPHMSALRGSFLGSDAHARELP